MLARETLPQIGDKKVADEIDKAQDREAELLADALAVRKPIGPPPCGFCYNCEEPVHPGARWCDLECKADWERIQVVKRDNAGRYYDWEE